jgi:signal transduction histidine kinase
MTTRASLRLTLWSKLVLFTTAIVVVTCSAQGWFFIQEHAAVVTKGLVANGIDLARHLATGNRYSLLVGDSVRIREQIAGLLAIPHVTYVVIRASDGRLLDAAGNNNWQKFFVDQRGGDFLSPPALPATDYAEPIVRPIHLDHGVPHVVNGAPSLLSRLPDLVWSPLETEIGYFDIALPILSSSATYDDDPGLSLTLEEISHHSAGIGVASKVRLGTVQIGLSDAPALTVLRAAVVQVLLLIGLTIALGTIGVFYLARWISTPIKALKNAASRLEAGDYSIQAMLSSSDEIGELTRTFNNMVRSIQQHEQSLQEANQALETRVHKRTAELELANDRLQELNHLKTTLVSSASHELRTPITAISIHLSNLMSGVSGTITPRQGAALGHIQENTERLQRMVEDLLDLSRLQGHKAPFVPAPVQLDRIVHDSLLVFIQDQKQKRLSLRVDISTSLNSVWGEGDRLRQIFVNLIHNAIKFSRPGGEIRVTAQGSQIGVTVCVADSGCGIPSDEVDKIFLPFFRCSNGTHARGTGLGLSIVKELVELHGGTVRVESILGKGSRFFVDLPTTLNTTTRQSTLTNTVASSTSLSASVAS